MINKELEDPLLRNREENLELDALSDIDERPEEERRRFDFIFERIERIKQYYFKFTQGSISGSVFCLLCLTFGSGILALPYSFKKCGLILGSLLFIISSYSVYWTMSLLVKVAYDNKILNYSKLINKFYGKEAVLIYELFNLFANLGGMIIYQQISKDISYNTSF